MILNNNVTEAVGCPVDEQSWCAYTPVMTFVQFLLGYFLTSIGYPIGITVIQTLFSKILGPRPQVRYEFKKVSANIFLKANKKKTNKIKLFFKKI